MSESNPHGQGGVPTHVCLDCGALGYAGGYHDHGGGNAGETVALTALPRMMSAFHDVEMDRDMQDAWNTRLVAAIDLLLEHADDFTDDALLVRRSDVRGLREVRRDG